MKMNRWVGVQSILSASAPLKQEALIFNRIAVIGLNFGLDVVSDPHAREALRLPPKPELYDLLWLIEQGIVFDAEDVLPDSALIESEEFKRYENLQQEQLEKMNTVLSSHAVDRNDVFTRLAKRAQHADKAEEYYLRSTCVQLRELCNIEAYPILWNELNVSEDSPAERSDLIQIVLKAIPVPDESTSWEQIMEYRSDPDSQDKFLDLRNWMSDVARAELAPIEAKEKLEWLMSQYQRRMNLHKMKTHPSTLKAYIIASARFAENFIKGNWGKLAEQVLIQQNKIALMESESTSPGSEVAYVIEAREHFS
jgi:hypothetical protein